MAIRLTNKTIEFIKKNDADLYGPISEVLGIKVNSVEKFLERNARRLTEYPVLKILSDYIGKDINSLIEEVADETVSE